MINLLLTIWWALVSLLGGFCIWVLYTIQNRPNSSPLLSSLMEYRNAGLTKLDMEAMMLLTLALVFCTIGWLIHAYLLKVRFDDEMTWAIDSSIAFLNIFFFAMAFVLYLMYDHNFFRFWASVQFLFSSAKWATLLMYNPVAEIT